MCSFWFSGRLALCACLAALWCSSAAFSCSCLVSVSSVPVQACFEAVNACAAWL